MATREEMKKEAIERMKRWKMMKNPIKEFEEDDVLNMSEGPGILYWLDDNQKEFVKHFEESFHCLAYHVVRSLTNIGEMFTILYVSKDDEEWEYDRNDIDEGVPLCYVINKDYPDCSEFGSCSISPMNGGLVRRF